MERLKALLRLTRPPNVGLAAISVVIGAVTGSLSVAAWSPVLWAALSAALVTAGGNTLNDVADVAVDRINKPGRPLPSGAISTAAAAWWAGLLMAGGVASSYPLPAACRLIVLFAVAAICAYNFWGKGQPLIGNLMVSIISGLAFFYGSLAADRVWWGLIPGVLAFFFHFGREIIKDLEDMEADRTGGLRTWPLVGGEAAARHTAQAVLIVLLLILVLPTLQGWLAVGYLIVAVVGLGIPVAVIVIGLHRQPDTAAYRRYQLILKWDMLVGLAAILLGSI